MFLHSLRSSWAASIQVLCVHFLHEALQYLNCARPWHFYSIYTLPYVKSKGAFQVKQDKKAPSLAR